MGIAREADGTLRRLVPRPLSEVAHELSQTTELDRERCDRLPRELLVRGSSLIAEGGMRVVAFKLHQFVAQGRTLYATLEDRATRKFSLEGQLQAG